MNVLPLTFENYRSNADLILAGIVTGRCEGSIYEDMNEVTRGGREIFVVLKNASS